MRKTLILLASFFVVLSIIFSVLPLGTLAFLPIGIALLLSFFGLKKSEGSRRKFPKTLLVIGILCLLWVLGKEFFTKEEVAKDNQFEQTIEQSKAENKKDLEDLEKDLE